MLLCGLFSSFGERELPSSGDVQASPCGGFFCCRAWALGCGASVVAVPGLSSTGSIVVAHRLSCSIECGIFLDQGSNLCLLHWQADSLPLSHKGSPYFIQFYIKILYKWLVLLWLILWLVLFLENYSLMILSYHDRVITTWILRFQRWELLGRLAPIHGIRNFPGDAAVKNLPAVQEPREMRVRSLGWEDLLEECMATHSCILAWRIPWTEEPGGLQSTGSQRVRHDWSDLTCILGIRVLNQWV